MMRKSYPSDITREQFKVIRPLLEGATKTTHPRKYDLYDIFCAVLYLLKEGCTWRAIPHDFPKWENVRYHSAKINVVYYKYHDLWFDAPVYGYLLGEDGRFVIDEEAALVVREIYSKRP